MKLYFYAFSMCQSMFCSIPFPCHVWEEKARGKMLLFLPVIGLEIGLIWSAFAALCGYFNLDSMIFALGMTLIPYVLTGFIHLDGFMDVTDAVGSCRDLEKRRAILKDSHVGSFAVIGIVILLLSMFSLFAAIKPETNLWTLVLIPCISRTCAGIAVLTLPKMSTSQYHDQAIPKSQIAFMTALLILFVILEFVLFGIYGLCSLGCIAGCILALRKGYRSLEGMNGDISGYSLTIGELAAVAVLAIL